MEGRPLTLDERIVNLESRVDDLERDVALKEFYQGLRDAAPDDDPPGFCYNCTSYSIFAGECRRHAPAPRLAAIVFRDDNELDKKKAPDTVTSTAFVWPETSPRDWCGEYEQLLDKPVGGWLTDVRDHPIVDKAEQ